MRKKSVKTVLVAALMVSVCLLRTTSAGEPAPSGGSIRLSSATAAMEPAGEVQTAALFPNLFGLPVPQQWQHTAAPYPARPAATSRPGANSSPLYRGAPYNNGPPVGYGDYGYGNYGNSGHFGGGGATCVGGFCGTPVPPGNVWNGRNPGAVYQVPDQRIPAYQYHQPRPGNAYPTNVLPGYVRPQNVRPQNVRPQNVRPQNVRPVDPWRSLDSSAPESSSSVYF